MNDSIDPTYVKLLLKDKLGIDIFEFDTIPISDILKKECVVLNQNNTVQIYNDTEYPMLVNDWFIPKEETKEIEDINTGTGEVNISREFVDVYTVTDGLSGSVPEEYYSYFTRKYLTLTNPTPEELTERMDNKEAFSVGDLETIHPEFSIEKIPDTTLKSILKELGEEGKMIGEHIDKYPTIEK